MSAVRVPLIAGSFLWLVASPVAKQPDVDWGSLIITSPVAGALVYLIFDERKERRSVSAQHVELIKDMIPALEKSNEHIDKGTRALERVARTLERISERGT